MDLAAAALDYARRGRRILPLEPRAKTPYPGSGGVHDATNDVERVARWWREKPESNIGLATGEPNGFVVVDIDPRNGGSAETLRLPSTLTVSTGSGTHFYLGFRPNLRSAILRPGVDLKSTGGYVVAPPSIHPSGAVYSVMRRLGIAEFPAHLVNGHETTRVASSGVVVGDKIPLGMRNSVLASLGGSMRAKGCTPPTILLALLAENVARCDPPLQDSEVGGIARSVSRYDTARSLELTLASTVQPEEIKWIWQGRIPRGKVTVLDGDPGLGKSTVATAVVAAITGGGTLPGNGSTAVRGNAIMASAEDGYADTIVPRLKAAGADLSKVHFLDGLDLSKWQHTTSLQKAIQERQAAFVVIDPLMAFLGYTDSYRDQAIREVLRRLAEVSEETGVAVLLIRHLNKMTDANILYRGGGSIGITAAARSVMLLAMHPDDAETRLLATIKLNLGRRPPSLRFRLEGDPPRVAWQGESNLNVEDL